MLPEQQGQAGCKYEDNSPPLLEIRLLLSGKVASLFLTIWTTNLTDTNFLLKLVQL